MEYAGNTKHETVRPAYFFKQLQGIKTSVTLKYLADIEQLPIFEKIEKMQDLGKKELKNLEKIEILCNQEIAYLLQTLKPNTVNSAITLYRRFLDDKGLETNPYRLYFKMPIEIAKNRKSEYQKTVHDRQIKQRNFIDHNGYIDRTISLLRSKKSYINIMLGLCAATGRRPSEILTTAKFQRIDNDNAVFSGQLKNTKMNIKCDSARDNYAIPLLVSFDEIDSAMIKLRLMRDFTTLSVPPTHTLAQVVNRRTAKTQSEQVKAHYSRFLENVKVYDLRHIYVSILVNTGRIGSENAHIANVLGHSETDMTTANSYTDIHFMSNV